VNPRHLNVLSGFLVLLGFGELIFGLVESGLMPFGSLSLLLVGWGTGIELLGSFFANTGTVVSAPGSIHLQLGTVLWLLGWGLLAVTFRNQLPQLVPPQVKEGLHPRLAKYVDFHWGTLLAYGFGLLIAELALVRVYLALVGKAAVEGESGIAGLSPVMAFSVSFAVALGCAFAGGFLGAANSKRLSTPEATLAVLYFGLPVPIFLTVLHSIPKLNIEFGSKLREIIYLSSMLGENRPELGYWLVTAALTLGFFLGINFGFVATSSGRLDLRTSYELFIASRHVSVFRPRLLAGVFLVLFFGVIAPLIVWAIISAAEAVVERTRIKRLGLKDPLEASTALHQLKLKAQTPTAMMTTLSVGGVGVGVMALIIVLSVMSGFEADLQQKILGTNSHGVVMKYDRDMPEYEEVLGKVNKVRGIAGATPFILTEVMISSEGNISGSMLKGIDPRSVGQVTDLPGYLLPGGKLEWLEEPARITRKQIFDGAFDDRPAGTNKGAANQPTDIERDPLVDLTPAEPEEELLLPGILVGRELAAALRVVVGDRLNVVSPMGGELGPQGPMPKSRPFRVAGILYSGMYEYDSKFVYVHLSEAQRFFDIKGATGIEVKVKDVDNARGTMKSVYDMLQGYPYRTKDWGEMNRNLFAALRLEKLVMGIILSIIVVVATGLIVATVIMLVLEKRKEISVLKALGVPDGGIVKIFLAAGLQIGVAGGALGLIAGLAWCAFIERVGIKLDPQVYYIPALPVRVEPFQTALSVVGAILVTFLASIYPALKASEVEPVEGLKSE
jgi:lipoprotein-releasing system permease protein